MLGLGTEVSGRKGEKKVTVCGLRSGRPGIGSGVQADPPLLLLGFEDNLVLEHKCPLLGHCGKCSSTAGAWSFEKLSALKRHQGKVLRGRIRGANGGETPPPAKRAKPHCRWVDGSQIFA